MIPFLAFVSVISVRLGGAITAMAADNHIEGKKIVEAWFS